MCGLGLPLIRNLTWAAAAKAVIVAPALGSKLSADGKKRSGFRAVEGGSIQDRLDSSPHLLMRDVATETHHDDLGSSSRRSRPTAVTAFASEGGDIYAARLRVLRAREFSGCNRAGNHRSAQLQGFRFQFADDVLRGVGRTVCHEAERKSGSLPSRKRFYGITTAASPE